MSYKCIGPHVPFEWSSFLKPRNDRKSTHLITYTVQKFLRIYEYPRMRCLVWLFAAVVYLDLRTHWTNLVIFFVLSRLEIGFFPKDLTMLKQKLCISYMNRIQMLIKNWRKKKFSINMIYLLDRKLQILEKLLQDTMNFKEKKKYMLFFLSCFYWNVKTWYLLTSLQDIWTDEIQIINQNLTNLLLRCKNILGPH